MNDPSWGDTTTGNDMVKKQYESLPYPPVSEQFLSAEEEWYATKQAPMRVMPSDRLQKLNHYLYRGNESFE